MEQRPLAQGTGSRNNVVNVYPDRVEIWNGYQNRSNSSVRIKQVANVSLKGLINCTLTIEVNDGRHLSVESLAPPDARQIKAAIERQKRMAGL